MKSWILLFFMLGPCFNISRDKAQIERLEKAPVVLFSKNASKKNINHGILLAMVPQPGGLPSRVVNSAASPPNGCRTRVDVEDRRNGTSVRRTTITCSKTEVLDREDRVTKSSDTSSARYQKPIKRFTGNSSSSSSSKNNHRK